MSGVLAGAVGAIAGLATILWARRKGRAEPRVWRQVLIIMQAIYLAFAALALEPGGSLVEGAVLTIFVLVAVAGTRFSAWFLVLGMLAHGGWDLRHLLAGSDYVWPFYPEACVGYDWLVFFYLATRAAAWDRARGASTAREAAV